MRYSTKKKLCMVISIIFVLQLFINVFPKIALANSSDTFLIYTTSNVSEAFSGDEFTYTIKYSFSSDTSPDVDGAVIEDTLPDEVQYVSYVSSTDIQSVQMPSETDGKTVRFILKDNYPAGNTGIVKINVKFPNGTTLDGTSAVNSASMKSPDVNGNTPVVSTPVTVTSKLKNPNWSINKTKTIPSGNPVPGTPVTYAVSVTGNSGSGQLNLENTTLVDTLPTGAVFESVPGGSYDVGLNTVTWDLGNVNVGQTVTKYIIVSYPVGTFDVGSSVTNILDCSADPYGGGIQETRQVSCSHGFDIPIPGAGIITKTSRQTNDEYSTGQTSLFYIGNIVNTGNVPLDNFNIVDTLPKEIDITRITTGQYNSDVTLTINYMTNNTPDWVQWDVYDKPPNISLNTSDLHLSDGEYLTKIQWDFGTVPVGFRNTANIAVNGSVLSTDHNKDAVSLGASIENSAVLNASYGGSVVSDVTPVSSSVTVVSPIPWLTPSKSVVGASSVKPGDTVTYRLRIKNHDFATGNYNNPIAVDVLDDSLAFIPYDMDIVTWDKGNTGITTPPKFTLDNSSGKTVLTWSWPNSGETPSDVSLAPGQYVDITFKAQVKANTSVGSVPNTFYITTQDGVPFKSTPAAVDATGIVVTPNEIVPASANIFVQFVGSISSELLLKGELDSTWTKSPDYGQTLPGGVVDYKLTVSNSNANGPIRNIVIIDKLPYLGDTGVIDTGSRGSLWSPFLVGKMQALDELGDLVDLVDLPAGIKVYYSTTANPSCSEFNDPVNNTGSPGDNWTETPPSDITTVRSIKIDCRGYNSGNGLDKGETIGFYWPMRAPVGAPLSQIAWNSFGYVATYTDQGANPGDTVQEPFLPAEPLKVGFQVKSNPAGTYNIGNYVWEDMNRNGIQDDGDKGINGVKVELYDKTDLVNPIAYTMTGFDQSPTPKAGYYNFPDASPGSYQVKFTIPSGYYTTIKDADADTVDSDIDASGWTDPDAFDVVGSNIDYLDAGLYRKAAFSGHVWKDLDGDGVQDAGEQGINDVTITLYDSSNNQVGAAIKTSAGTDGKDGYYKFDNLDPDKYHFVVENPDDTNYVFSPHNAGGSDTKDSDVDSGGTSDEITLLSGNNLTNWDAGLHQAAIGDYVWEDMDGNGIQNESNKGINGVVVHLLDKNGVEKKQTTTVTGGPNNAAGYYFFSDLAAVDYKIKFDLKTGYNRFSLQNAIGDDTKDSDADNTQGATEGQTNIITLVPGQIDNDVDAGMYKYASVGNFVWNDKNADGTWNAGEPGLKDVAVDLIHLDSDGNTIETTETTTDVNGAYAFTSLDPGNYKVKFTILNSEYIFSPKSGTITNNKSNADVTTGTTVDFTLTSGQVNNSIDTGMHRASFGGYVWDDLDADGIKDGGEPVIQGVMVDLLNADGSSFLDGSSNPVTAVTSVGGYYEFNDLSPSTYKAKFEKPASYIFSLFHNPLATSTTDSDADQANGMTDNIALGIGQRDITYDAQMYIPVNIGDYVWEDSNYDGIQGAGENGISGAIVNLYKDGVKTETATTDINGAYGFTNLIPGNYMLEFIKPDGYEFTLASQGGDSTKDSNTGAGAGTISFVLTSGHDDYTLDAGFYKPVSIGSIVWDDKNDDGIREPGDNGIGGVTVQLYKDGSLTDATTTDSNGMYNFTNLKPGTYSVKFQPVGYEFTARYAGGDTALDSDADSFGDTANITLLSGQSSLTTDGGIFKLCSIGDTVWEDMNGNSIQDMGEPGIEGVTVNLYDSGGSKINSAVTASDGTYSFLNLLPGNYTVEFVTPAGGYEPSTPTSDAVTLVSGEINNDIDAGFYKRGSIGDYVWKDVNTNGIQDPDEKSMENIQVNLYDSGGTKIDSVTSDVNGSYLFANLVPGQYTLEFVSPGGYAFTPSYLGSDVSKDSNAGPNGKTSVTLLSGRNIDDVDAGLYLAPVYTYFPASLGDFVWEDENYNGIQDAGERGIAGIAVNLYNVGGTKVNTVFTDADGHYSFSNLFPGRYKVEFSLPGGYKFTTVYQGGDISGDSDAESNGRSKDIDLLSGQNDNTVDAGMFRFASLGDLVWQDDNKNGLHDPGENGIAGVVVNLYDLKGQRIKTAVTGMDGTYLFNGLKPGSYKVEFIKPKGYEFTSELSGEDKTLNSKAGKDGVTSPIVLASGQNDSTVDAGVVKTEPQKPQDNPMLPKTGNGYYTYLALGCAAAFLSGIMLLLGLKRRRKPKH